MTTAARRASRAHVQVRERAANAFARRRVRDAVALLLFAAFTALWFNRLLLHAGSAVLYGPNDESYGIRQYWGAEFLHLNPFTETRDPLNGAPEGLPIATAVQVANFMIPATIWTLHYVVGFTAASNIYLLGGLVLTGFSAYLLLERLGLHPVAAFYAAYAFTFNPWMLTRAGAGHSGFMQAWIFPLLVAAMLYVHRRRTVVAAILVGLVLALAFYDNSYYGLMAGLVFAIFWIVDFARQPGWHDRLWSFTLMDVAFVTAVVAFIPALVAWLSNRRAISAGVSNPVQEVQSLGATTQAYLFPPARNPVLGRITTHFYPEAVSKWSENTLYLGWSLIAIGIVGAVLVLRRHPITIATPTRRYFLVAVAILVPAAFLMSLQRETTWFGLTIPMPSYVLTEFTTFWRVFARFALLVTFGLAVLAGVALTAALARGRIGVALTAAAFALLVFEYCQGILPIYRLDPAPYSTWLARQPPGIVANYPMPTDSDAAIKLLARTYYQQVYNHHAQFMLFGGGYGGTREDAIRVLVRYVTDPVTPGVLKAEGVRYILLHDDVYREEGVTPPPVPTGFHLVARVGGNVRVLALDAGVQPADISAVLEQNAAAIGAAQSLPTPRVQIAGRDVGSGAAAIDGSARVDLTWDDVRLRRATLIVQARSVGQTRTLELRGDDGHVYGSWPIGTAKTQVSFGPLPLAGSTSVHFTLTTSPAGQMRIVSVQPQPLADFSVSIRDW